MEQFIFKVVGWLINIDRIILFFLVIGLILLFTRFWRWGRRSIFLSAFLLISLAVVPTGFWMMTWLENRFPQVQELSSDAKGLILMGGSFNWYVTISRDRPCYTMAGGRLMDFVALANKYPELPILFTGGGRHSNPRANESLNTKQMFQELGLDLDRVTFEDKSKDTIENAKLSYELIKPEPGDKWVLVGSA